MHFNAKAEGIKPLASKADIIALNKTKNMRQFGVAHET